MIATQRSGGRDNGPKDPMLIYRGMYQKIISEHGSHPTVLDLKVIENLILEDEDNYNLLRNRIKLYNKKVLKDGAQPIDSY
jgi:hypothetical protein